MLKMTLVSEFWDFSAARFFLDAEIPLHSDSR